MENKKNWRKHTISHINKKSTDATKQKTLTIELQHIDFTKRYSVTVLQLDSKGYSKQVLLYIFIYI